MKRTLLYIYLFSLTLIINEANAAAETLPINMKNLIEKIDCSDKEWVTKHKVEDTDRKHYKPLDFISAHIKTNKALSDGFQKASKQSYLLSVETYSTSEQAKLRAQEYTTDEWRKRLSQLEGFSDFNHIAKESMRCFAYSKGQRVYMLTTHSSYAKSVSHIIAKELRNHLEIKKENKAQ